eukprot:scaffold171878_cov14-Prasinocladus_malaysianus.AAC.1
MVERLDTCLSHATRASHPVNQALQTHPAGLRVPHEDVGCQAAGPPGAKVIHRQPGLLGYEVTEPGVQWPGQLRSPLYCNQEAVHRMRKHCPLCLTN